jgi:histidinol-phosphate phosphatase family protein
MTTPTSIAAASPQAQVAILAGGMGTRLKARTGSLPKPMVPIHGRPVLEYQIELCRRYGFTSIALLVHYEHKAISDFFGDGSRWGVELLYRIEKEPRGTAGALRDALDALAPRFLVLYADTFLDVDLRKMWEAHARSQSAGTLFLHPNDHPQDSDLVEVNAAGEVMCLHPYPHPVDFDCRNLVNAALYVLERDPMTAAIPENGKHDLAKHTFAALLAEGRTLNGYVSPEYIKDMGTPERLDKVERDIVQGLPERLSDRNLRSAIFFDRDGTLNKEVGHLRSEDQLELLPGAADAVRLANRNGMLAITVTNQPVVARGDVTLAKLDRIHARLDSLLGREHAYLDRIYFCPHHPDAGFENEVRSLKTSCQCRKPLPGLIVEACRDLHIDPSTSWMIGDTASDVEAGRAAGCRTILVRTGHAGADSSLPMRPDYVMPDALAAVDWVLRGRVESEIRMAPIATAALSSRLVLIGGLARSGKSSAAQVLKEMLAARGRMAHVVALDSWLVPIDQRQEGAGVLSRYNVEEIERSLLAAAAESTTFQLVLPVYDRSKRRMHSVPTPFSIQPDDVIVVEGVPALMLEQLRTHAQVLVHMEVPEPVRTDRARIDYQWRGYVNESSLEALLRSRTVDEAEPVTASARFAHFHVSSAEK